MRICVSYPIYSFPSTGDGAPGSVNSQLNEVKEIIGTLITKGEPVPLDDPDNYSSEQELPKGFDSYLGGPNRVIPAAPDADSAVPSDSVKVWPASV